MTQKEIKRAQKDLDKLYKIMQEETSSFGMDILAEIVEAEIQL